MSVMRERVKDFAVGLLIVATGAGFVTLVIRYEDFFTSALFVTSGLYVCGLIGEIARKLYAEFAEGQP